MNIATDPDGGGTEPIRSRIIAQDPDLDVGDMAYRATASLSSGRSALETVDQSQEFFGQVGTMLRPLGFENLGHDELPAGIPNVLFSRQNSGPGTRNRNLSMQVKISKLPTGFHYEINNTETYDRVPQGWSHERIFPLTSGSTASAQEILQAVQYYVDRNSMSIEQMNRENDEKRERFMQIHAEEKTALERLGFQVDFSYESDGYYAQVKPEMVCRKAGARDTNGIFLNDIQIILIKRADGTYDVRMNQFSDGLPEVRLPVIRTIPELTQNIQTELDSLRRNNEQNNEQLEILLRDKVRRADLSRSYAQRTVPADMSPERRVEILQEINRIPDDLLVGFVYHIQKALGFSREECDGIVGPRTETAMKEAESRIITAMMLLLR